MPIKTKSVPVKGVRAPLPIYIEPMRASLVEPPVRNKPGWLYEVKYDGYRALARLHQGNVTLGTKGGLDYASKFQPIANALKKIKLDIVLDGEIIVLDENGRHNFNLVENYGTTRRGTPVYYVFDVVWLNGHDLMGLQLIERKRILDSLAIWNSTVKKADVFDDGEALFEKVQQFGFEGIVCKNMESIYTASMKRSRSWLKVKYKTRLEYVIIGYIKSDSPSLFKTILLGQYVKNKLKYVHHCGHGFTDKKRKELFEMFKLLETKKPSVVNSDEVEYEGTPTWLIPELVGVFEQENVVTKSGKIRHPVIYKGGLRLARQREEVIDKKPLIKEKQVKVENREVPKVTAMQPKEITATWEDVENRPVTSRKKTKIAGKEIELVNLEKKLWDDVTKEDLINYYKKIWPYISMYLKDRPLALNINLHGPFGDNFFLRGLEGHAPAWAETFTTQRKHLKKGKSALIHWLVCNDLATLIWMINLECIDVHPWSSRVQTFKEADYIVIDLDPTISDTDNDEERKIARKEGFSKAVETALAARQLFKKHKLISFIKTSGKTGLHLYLPCRGIKYGEEKQKGEARTIAENICNEIHELVSDITTTSFSQAGRGDKVYIDPSQNDWADRVAVAYCCRANYLPAVSAPLDWKEVNQKLSPGNFTIHNLLDRAKKKGDLWKGLFEKKISQYNAEILRNFL